MKHGIMQFLLLGFLIVQPACSASPLFYSAEAIEARVVDAETKKPIEGVVVTANWQLFHSTVGGRVPGDQLMVMEAVTDKDGKFAFAAWGPKPALWGYLDNRDPQLLLFKPGYEYKRLTNEVSSKTNMASRRRSEWNGNLIELKRFNDHPITIGPYKYETSAYAQHLSFLMTSLRFIEDDCHWKTTPRMILALQKQSEIFRASGITTTLYSVDYLPTDEAKCGSPKDFFQSFKP